MSTLAANTAHDPATFTDYSHCTTDGVCNLSTNASTQVCKLAAVAECASRGGVRLPAAEICKLVPIWRFADFSHQYLSRGRSEARICCESKLDSCVSELAASTSQNTEMSWCPPWTQSGILFFVVYYSFVFASHNVGFNLALLLQLVMIRTALALTRRTTLTRLVRPLKRALSTRAQPALAVPRAAAKLSGTARAEGEEPILDIWSTLKVDAPLATGTRRCKCPKCNTAVSYYCAKCLIPIAPPDANANASAASASASQSAASPLPVGIERLPVAPFRLPIDVDILHDRREKLTQSSAVHAAVLCPQQVRLLPFRPTLHDKLSFDPQSTLLLYPDPKAPTVSEIDPTKFTRAVAIGTFLLHCDLSISVRPLCAPRLALAQCKQRAGLAAGVETSTRAHQQVSFPLLALPNRAPAHCARDGRSDLLFVSRASHRETRRLQRRI